MAPVCAGGADRLLAELKVIIQESGECVGNYGQRVQISLNRLLNTYNADRSLQVRAANPKTLVEALTKAVRVE